MGRYWLKIIQGDCKPCYYNETFQRSSCNIGCGEPSQRYYHIPNDWLYSKNNLLVIFEEIGGDPSNIKIIQVINIYNIIIYLFIYYIKLIFFFIKRKGGIVCGKGEENWPKKDNNTLYIQCDPSTYIKKIDFVSFGNPSGTCGSFKLGNCHSVNSMDIVKNKCFNYSSCHIPISEELFGNPCPSIVNKSLFVQVICDK